MRLNKVEKAVHDYMIPARVIWLCAAWGDGHSAGLVYFVRNLL